MRYSSPGNSTLQKKDGRVALPTVRVYMYQYNHDNINNNYSNYNNRSRQCVDRVCVICTCSKRPFLLVRELLRPTKTYSI